MPLMHLFNKYVASINSQCPVFRTLGVETFLVRIMVVGLGALQPNSSTQQLRFFVRFLVQV